MQHSGNRRHWLKQAATLAAATMLPAHGLCARRRKNDLFGLGVASGDPSPDGFVIWTRLIGEPDGTAFSTRPVEVQWEVAHDERFQRFAARGEALAWPEMAHSVHVEVTGLAPDRWYFYRFIARGQVSRTGRSRTFPEPATRPGRLRFAFASCQHYGQGYFTAYRAMLEDELDFIVHLGDYVYESTWGPVVRPHPSEPSTLAGYRRLHAQYKQDPALQDAHARYPFLVIWDDHEVENDYAGTYAAKTVRRAAFMKRRTAAYQAYYEHMPLRAAARPQGPGLKLHSRRNFGELASIHLLDGRQYRSDQACGSTEHRGGRMIGECSERLKPDRSLLGEAQERWLYRGLADSGSQWQIIAQPSLMAQLRQPQDGKEAYWSDGWDGYPANRRRLLDHIAEAKLRDVVVIGGDIHSYWAADLKPDFDDPRSAAVASEFVTTSVSSEGPAPGKFEPALAGNPHIRFFDGRRRGYVRAEVTEDLWKCDLRVVDTVIRPNSQAGTLRSFIVESGRAGPQEA